jgi:hypothetical protein
MYRPGDPRMSQDDVRVVDVSNGDVVETPLVGVSFTPREKDGGETDREREREREREM